MNKNDFDHLLHMLVKDLHEYVCSDDWQRKIKGFIDELKNIYTISSDTKIISKILEIQIFPKILEFANVNWFELETAEKQNYYPDMTLIYKKDKNVKFAVDFKSTYKTKNNECNWFTLGSHGEYFIDRTSTKNIQYPYGSYSGHFCLWMIYDKSNLDIDETQIYKLQDITFITSVISNIIFFVQEKRKIASDIWWSWNTANIGSIKNIDKLIAWKWVFANLWEEVFDEYWMNYWRLQIRTSDGNTKKLTQLEEFLRFKNLDLHLVNKP